ncbi:hypothetical protein H0H87_007920 [Tephrocybe sp. NHM501043]|nr:hypothetical protein H0H87_007920 [Tephrocybe sp. NHM501043]
MASTLGWFDAEAQISEDLEKIAPMLSGLERFIWDGIEPPEETLWVALRIHDLRELTLGGERTTYYTPLFDVRPIVHGRWPKLRSLTFGHTMMQDNGPLILSEWDPMSQDEGTKEFSRFISSHPHLRKLHIPYDARFPPLEIQNSDIKLQKDFWRAIENGPRLRTLEVQKVYTFNEEKMAKSALHIARCVPTLQGITLVYAEQPWSGLVPIRVKQTGVYDISMGNKSNQVRVTAEENGKGLFKAFSRRTTRTSHWRSPAQRMGHYIG